VVRSPAVQPVAVRRVAPAASVISILLLALVAATPGSPFLPILPTAALPSGPLRWLSGAIGLADLGETALAAVGVVSVVVAAAAFVVLMWAAWRGEVAVRTVLAIAIVGHVLVLLLPLLFSRDVYSYAYYGRIAGTYHANPYVATPADFPNDVLARYVGPKWVDTPAVYGPLWVLVSSAVVRVATNVTAMIVAFRLLAIAASLATLGVIVGSVRRDRPERTAFAIAAFGANPVILFHSVASGHNDLFVALAIAGGYALVRRGRPRLAIVALALGALVKVTAGLPLLLLVVALVARSPAGKRLREAAVDIGLAAIVAAAFAVPFLQASDPTLGMLELAGHEGWLAPSRFFHRLLDVVHVGWLARVVFAAALVAVVVAIAGALVRARGRPDDEIGAGWGWGLLFLVLLGPVLLPWYVAWVLPLAWLLPREPRVIAVAVSAALIVSQLRTEPATLPQLYSTSLIIGHYVITPFVIAMLGWSALELWRRVRTSTPLREERGVPAGRDDPEHQQAGHGAVEA
jgi:alpha-1,6-mannosyltransferase